MEKILARHGLHESKQAEPGILTIRTGALVTEETFLLQRLPTEFERQHPFADAMHTAIQAADSADMSLKPVTCTGIVFVSAEGNLVIGAREAANSSYAP